jgi:hypothetical protein
VVPWRNSAKGKDKEGYSLLKQVVEAHVELDPVQYVHDVRVRAELESIIKLNIYRQTICQVGMRPTAGEGESSRRESRDGEAALFACQLVVHTSH